MTGGLGGAPVCGRTQRFLQADNATPRDPKEVRMTKSEEVVQKVEKLMDEGISRADAFKQLAESYGQPVNSIRGLFYAKRRATGDGPRRTRRRETTPEDAVADARAALERAMQAIDREVEQAAEHAVESKREYEALKAGAAAKKKAISERLEALS
jgi:hypothetical protein